MGRQNEWDADTKAIQQIEFVGKSKNMDDINANEALSMAF